MTFKHVLDKANTSCSRMEDMLPLADNQYWTTTVTPTSMRITKKTLECGDELTRDNKKKIIAHVEETVVVLDK
jgi:hypothetical protein